VPMLFECSLNVVWMLSLETTFKQLWLRVANISKIVHKSFFLQMLCCLSVVWMLSLETTFRQLWAGVANISKIFHKKSFLQMLSECCLWRQHSDNFGCEVQTCPRFLNKMQMLSECCLWRQHWDNIETTFGQKKCFSPFFGSK
jgi:hypothetical protein